MLAPIVIVGDSQACGAAQFALNANGTAGPSLAGEHPVRLACKVGSRTSEWSTKIAEVAIDPGDWVAIYLGSNDYDSKPDPNPILANLVSRGVNRVVWVGPPRIRDKDGAAPDFIAAQIGDRPNVVFYDTRALALKLADGIHPATAAEHRRWFAGVLQTFETGAPAAPAPPLVSGIDPPFWPKLVSAARSVNADPRDWAAVFLAESDLSPTSSNNKRDAKGNILLPLERLAIGINQFSLYDGGVPGADTYSKVVGPSGLTPEQYLSLPASKQLDFVIPFWTKKYKENPAMIFGGARDLYWLNFLPVTYRPHAANDFEITRGGAARSNMLLVLPEDKASPVIRPAGIDAFLANAQKLSKGRWSDILAAIDAAEKGASGPAFVPPNPSGPHAPPEPQRPPGFAEAGLAGPTIFFGVVGLVAWANRRRLNRGRI